MRVVLSLLLLFCGFTASAQQRYDLTGKVTDESGKAVPFASVHVQNTTKGSSANSEGEYVLQLPSGQYTIQYKAVGYKPETKKIDLKEHKVLNVVLPVEVYELRSVAINGRGEDPAYAIIRKAIKKRKTYLNEVKSYTADVYIKGLQRLLDAPKKFLGQNIDDIGKRIGLDSNRRGIIYLSESESKYSYIAPDKVHEEMISSKVSGSNRAFSYNRASDMRVNFYDNYQDWGRISLRPLVSPIADNALFYYRYQLVGETTENGQTVNKIKVTPRREHDPCFEGYVYIVDDSWRLVALELMITKKANIALADTIKVNQQYVPVSNTAWMPASIRFDLSGGLFGFRLGGYFISIFKNYDLDPDLARQNFNEVLRITREVNKKDSAYWDELRPIPLTAEEKTDYQKKAILARKRGSKEYLDSLDRVTNRIRPGNLMISGINIRDRYKRESYHLDPVIGSLLYNTVEGAAINYGISYTRQVDTINYRNFSLGGRIRYGFANRLLNANANVTIPIGQTMTLAVSGGSDVVDMNNRLPIPTLYNTLYTLFDRRNFQKLYQKRFASATLSGRIAGGWLASGGLEWADREWLPNSAGHSFFNPNNNQFTSNNPFTPNTDVPLFPRNRSFKFGLSTSYDFSNKYETYPAGRRYLPSEYPTIGFNYTKGLKNILGSAVDYDQVSVDVSKTGIKMGIYGETSFYLSAGKFLNANGLYYIDHKHFSGNQIFVHRGNINNYMLLDYYLYSTPQEYLEGHLEHNFSGFITNKIPLIRKLKLQEIISANYLATPALNNYYELGVGLQYFNFRVMYARSYNSGSNMREGLRIGFSFR